MEIARRFPIGAEVWPEGGVHFRVWAPHCRKVEVVFEGEGERLQPVELESESGGYFAGFVADAAHGTLYHYRLDDISGSFPDPVSRFQPEGPHGPSAVVDHSRFSWSDDGWRGVSLPGQVVYELHVGTFTRQGTYAAAARELAELADLGITVVEVMPVGEFPGRFGWGYDGVNIFAPTRLYGDPDDLRRFVDRAHSLGMGVILDVIYNHLGPDGNYLKHFSADYFTDRYKNEWGDAVNFDGDNSLPVREFFIANAGYWIEEFHIDGLRLDATQQIFDTSEPHILAEITAEVRQRARGRGTVVVAENECQHTRLVRPPQSGGFGIDGVWNDDFHHSAMVAMTGRCEAYYTDYRGTPQEFVSAIKRGYLYQGQWYSWQKQRRGTPTNSVSPRAFVTFIQNHDQIANSARGSRCHKLTSPGIFRAMTALLLLAPGTPMLFQGQEFAASSPFFYFADHNEDLSRLVARGRTEFLAQFRSLASKQMQAFLPDPKDTATFERSKLDLTERESHAEIYLLHRELLRMRREDPVFRSQGEGGMDGAVLSEGAFVMRFFGSEGDDRLLLVNLGTDLHLSPIPEPLLAPPVERIWKTEWSSEDPRYGGQGVCLFDTEENWWLPGQAAVVMTPVKDRKAKAPSKT